MTARKDTRTPPRGFSFAPGGMAPRHTIDHGQGACRGCRAHPSHLCAACGRPTAWVIPAGQHTLTMCDRCFSALLVARAEASPRLAAHLPRGRRMMAA